MSCAWRLYVMGAAPKPLMGERTFIKTVNCCQKISGKKRKKEIRREYIGDEGILLVAEGMARVKRRRQEEDELARRRKEVAEERA